jgi:hypothetical protein
MQATSERGFTCPSWGELSPILARAYLRLLSRASKCPTSGDLQRDKDPSESGSEGLDSRPGIAMTCVGQDDNPLAGEEL